jgi:hypothetical protein
MINACGGREEGEHGPMFFFYTGPVGRKSVIARPDPITPSAIAGEYLFPLFFPFLEEQETIFSQPLHEKEECNT